jgi:hypothetical protein
VVKIYISMKIRFPCLLANCLGITSYNVAWLPAFHRCSQQNFALPHLEITHLQYSLHGISNTAVCQRFKDEEGGLADVGGSKNNQQSADLVSTDTLKS